MLKQDGAWVSSVVLVGSTRCYCFSYHYY